MLLFLLIPLLFRDAVLGACVVSVFPHYVVVVVVVVVFGVCCIAVAVVVADGIAIITYHYIGNSGVWCCRCCCVWCLCWLWCWCC